MPRQGKRSPKPSKRVAELIDAGWTSACDGLVALAQHRIARSSTAPLSRFIDLYVGERHVQVYISPTGRSVRVYVDGTEA